MSDIKNQLIESHIQIVLKNIFDKIGRKNIVSVLLTGSTARNNVRFREVNGIEYIESDFDFVIVVNQNSLLKSLLLVKKLAKDVTLLLKNKKLLSHVSLSITTEDSLNNSKPSIFYHDLCLFGKIVYGKNVKTSLVKYEAKDIPIIDVYRLIFNRMTEFLSAFVSNVFLVEAKSKNDFELIKEQLGKLIFALIQAYLFKEKGIMVLSGFNLEEIEFDKIKSKQKTILLELIKSYKNYTSSRVDEISPKGLSEKNWNDIIRQVRLTIELLSTSKDSSPNFVKRLFKKNEGIGHRFRSSIINFLQYVKIYKISELLRTIFYNMKFGQDYVYFPLYVLFLSVPSLLNDERGLNKTKNYSNKPIKSGIYHEEFIKKWLDSFYNFYGIWKINVGF